MFEAPIKAMIDKHAFIEKRSEAIVHLVRGREAVESSPKTNFGIRSDRPNNLSFPNRIKNAGKMTALCICAALFSGSAAAQQGGNAAEAVFAKVSPSVVVIIVKDASGKPALQGSGVVIAPGRLITNCHVAQGGPRIEIDSGNKKLPATIQYTDPDRDLCELSVPSLAAPAITMSSVKNLKIGQQAFAVGAPEGLDLTISDGIVSSLRPIGNSFLIQTTAAISPGSSGGGLFNSQGQLIGITAFQFVKGQNLNFALPADWIAGIPSRSRTGVAAGRPASVHASNFFRSVWALAFKDDWQGLLSLATARTQESPRDEFAWFTLGWARDYLGESSRAVEAEKRAIELKPDDTGAWLELGAEYAKLGQNDRAIQADKQAIHLVPDVPLAWLNLAKAYYRLGQYDKAVEAGRQATQLKPDDVEGWSFLIAAYSELKQYDGAVEAAKRVIGLMPDNAYAWLNLRSVYEQMGRWDKAVEAARMAVQVKPDDATAWVELGWAYGGLGQWDKTVGAERQAIQLKSDDVDAWTDLSSAYDKLQEYDKAAEADKQAVQLLPTNPYLWFDLGLEYGQHLRQYDKAAEALREAVRLKPDFVDAWADLGVTYCAQGDRNSAISAYQVLQKLDPKKANMLFNACIVP